MKKTLGIIVIGIFLSSPIFIFGAAESTNVGGANSTNVSTPSGFSVPPQKLQNPLKSDFDTFPKFVAGVTKAAVSILMPFVVLAFIYSGFLFVKAQGNVKEIEAAQIAIWYSVIGAFILFGAWGFANIISTTVSTLTN